MISIQDGKLIIPEDERFIGIAGDNAVNEIKFALYHYHQRNSTFTLYLRFDDGTVRSAALSSAQYSSDILLTWTVLREHLYSSGVVTAQIRITDSNGDITHTSCDYFFVDSALEQDDAAAVSYATEAELDERIGAVRQQIAAALSFVGDDGKLYIRTAEDDIAAARASDVYTKTEIDISLSNYYTKAQIDGMIGGIESALAAV